jgi:hypothetical protein
MPPCNFHAQPTPIFNEGGAVVVPAAGIATEAGQVIETEAGQQIQPE